MKRSALKRKKFLQNSGWAKRKPPKKLRQHSDGGWVQEDTITRDTRPPRKRRKLRPRKKKATPEEQAHMDAVAEIGCIACMMDGTEPDSVMTLHHVKERYGSVRASHWEVLPLCDGHHQGRFDTTRLAFHKSARTWRARYGTEIQMLQVVYAAVGKDFDTIPQLRGKEPPWWQDYLDGKHAITNHRPAWATKLIS